MPVFINTNGGPLNEQQIEDIITFIGCGNWDDVARDLTGELGTPINAVPHPPNLGTPNARIIPGAVTTPAAGGGGAGKDPGALVFEAHCVPCHKITPDYPTGGGTGPDLTGIALRKIPSRSPIVPNQIDVPTEQAGGLTKWIRDPKSIRSSTGMPAFGTDKISDQDMATLTAWLMTHTTPPATGPAKSCFQQIGR